MRILVDNPRNQKPKALLQEHLQNMLATSPPQSVHALDLDALCSPEVTFWSAWQAQELMGCGALLAIDDTLGEVKSMRTATAFLRRGVGWQILATIIQTAEQRGYQKLSLETGSMVEFAPARAMYARAGFVDCEPFHKYKPDPNSVFMALQLPAGR